MSDFRQFVESIPTRELPPGYSVGEFGVGSYPFPPSPTVIEDLRHRPNLAWSFDNGKSYTGVDAGIVPPGHEYLGDVGYVRELAERRLNEYAARVAERRPQENIRFLFADATDQNLDIEPDELLMFNLLSSNISPESRERLAQQAARLLLTNGLLVVRETFSPHLHPSSQLTALLGRVGFGPIEVVGIDHSAFESLTSYYGLTVHDLEVRSARIKPRFDRYFCIAQRTEPTDRV